MAEHERNAAGSTRSDGSTDPDESQYRALCESADIPLSPSAALRERMAELAARHDAVTAQRHRSRPFGQPGWRLAASAVAATLCAALLGVTLIQWDHSRRPRLVVGAVNHSSMLATVPHPPRTAPRSGPVSGPTRPHSTSSISRQRRFEAVPRERSAPLSPVLVPHYPRVASSAVPPTSGSQQPGGAVDDLVYMNRNPETTLRQWAALQPDEWERIEARIRRSVRVRDDFVQIPFPRLASTSERQIAEAVEQYKKEAAIVDSRLSREVTLAAKAMAFSDLCDHLRTDTGIEISAGPSVADEKVTLFCEKRPLREIMRAINHVFGFTWLRSGVEGKYRYELTQDLRSQLAEEQLRNEDVQRAVLDLDKQMSVYRAYLQQSVDQLLARWEKAEGEEKRRLGKLVKNGGWGPAMLYFRLSPAERSTLLTSGRLEYSMDDPNPERRLPAEWRVPLLKSTGLRMLPIGTIIAPWEVPDKPSTPVDQVPNAEPRVRLQLDRSEAGEFTLQVGTYVNSVDRSNGKIISAGGAAAWNLVTGRSPSTTKPDNAAANQALRTTPLFRRVIDLQPRPSCPRLATDAERSRKGEPDPLYTMVFDPELREPHVNTADVWEAIHQRTGLPIVADSYLHLFPLPSVTVKQASTFDALCQVADQMGVRWRKDGDFLLGRSTRYFWDEIKEVPNRALRRWQQDSRANGGLPLSDLLEMASLSDLQLGSKTVGLPICHCWDLDEWKIVGTGPHDPAQRLYGHDVRKYARILSLLTPAQLQQAQQPEGVPLSDLKAAPREALLERFQWLLSDLPAGAQLRLHVDYIPSGCFIWSPWVTRAQFHDGASRWPTVAGTSVKQALAAARRYDPNADAESIRPTGGRLDFTFLLPGGERRSTGGPAVLVPLE